MEDELEFYRAIKRRLLGKDYEDMKLHSSFRKLRHHLDQMIVQLEKLLEN